jgi:hypothetical protein
VFYAFLFKDDAVLVTGDELPEDIAGLDAPPLADERSIGLMAARVVRSLKRR